MKSAVVYYSYSGTTKKVAEALAAVLSAEGGADIFALKAKDESPNFLIQCKRAFSHARAQLEDIQKDLSSYDLICFGTPIWAFGPAPAMNTYIDACTGIEGKNIVLFSTYGSGTGRERTMEYMRHILAGKGAKNFKVFGIQQFKAKDKDFVLSSIQAIMPLWPNG